MKFNDIPQAVKRVLPATKVNRMKEVACYIVETPFLNHAGNPLYFYIHRSARREAVLTDGGHMTAALNVANALRLDLFQKLLGSYGLILTEQVSAVEMTKRSFPKRLAAMTQALVAADAIVRTQLAVQQPEEKARKEEDA